MNLSEFDYNLPKELIANKPVEPRDSSKLLVYNQSKDQIENDYFFNLLKYLNTGDVLVFNNSKVFPARIFGRKLSGAKLEILLLKQVNSNSWEVMIKTKNPKVKNVLNFKNGLNAEIVGKITEKTFLIEFNKKDEELWKDIENQGHVPLPPYIENTTNQDILKKQYQTVYSKEIGSVAAPTAGLHFTNEIIEKIKEKGCKIEFVTLHVGLGTFLPVNTKKIEDYEIHEEFVSVELETLKRIKQSKSDGKKIIGIGTTSVRTLEAIFSDVNYKFDQDYNKNVNIFIYPGYEFKVVDAMITNFHLPKSSLLMLVSAFIGHNNMKRIYEHAINRKYRFYSFGDSMFLQRF